MSQTYNVHTASMKIFFIYHYIAAIYVWVQNVYIYRYINRVNRDQWGIYFCPNVFAPIEWQYISSEYTHTHMYTYVYIFIYYYWYWKMDGLSVSSLLLLLLWLLCMKQRPDTPCYFLALGNMPNAHTHTHSISSICVGGISGPSDMWCFWLDDLFFIPS